MRMNRQDYAGRTVFVTGGSMGIGLAAAKRFAALGAHVTIFARSAAPLEAAAAMLTRARATSQQRIAHLQLDVTDHSRVVQVMSAVVAESGAPDVLVNCPGGATPGYFEAILYERFVGTLRVNLHSCWSTISALVPHMKARGGYIVNTASLAGLIGVFGYTDYCAAKFGVIGFSEALRSELKPSNITVSVLCPPDTDTPGFAKENVGKPAETKAVSAAAHVMTAEAVGDALLRGMARGTFLIVPGVESRLIALAKRLAPGLVEYVMDRQIRGVRRPRSDGPV